MDPSKQPSVSVGLSELISGTREPASLSDSSSAKLSLIVPPNGDSFNSGTKHRNLPCSSNVKKQMPLDLQQTDILGPSEVVKQLLTLPYTQGSNYFAVHRLGNTLVLDSVEGMGEDERDQFPSATHKEDDLRRIGLLKPQHDTIATSPSTSEESLLDRLHLLEQQDRDSTPPPCSSAINRTGSTSTTSGLESSFLPPPEYYLPHESQPHSQPFRQVLRWQVTIYICTCASVFLMCWVACSLLTLFMFFILLLLLLWQCGVTCSL